MDMLKKGKDYLWVNVDRVHLLWMLATECGGML